MRHILKIGAPGSAADFDLIRQVSSGDKTVVAIRADPKCISAEHGQIIGQAGMSDGVILHQEGIAIRILVVIWHRSISDHRAKLMVLKKEHHDMFKIWHQRMNGRCRRWGRRKY